MRYINTRERSGIDGKMRAAVAVPANYTAKMSDNDAAGDKLEEGSVRMIR